MARNSLLKKAAHVTPEVVDYPTGNSGDIAVINYTSGSTGEPKGVMLRYECFSANAEYGQETEPSTHEDRLLSVLPMAHIFGMSFEMIYPLCGGTAVYFLKKAPAPSVLMQALAEIRPYHFTAVPMVYEKIYSGRIKPMLDRPAMRALTSIPGVRKIIYSKVRKSFDKAFGGNIQVYIMGGAAVNPELEDFFRKIDPHGQGIHDRKAGSREVRIFHRRLPVHAILAAARISSGRNSRHHLTP